MFAVATDVRLSRVGCDFWYTDHGGGGGDGGGKSARGTRERVENGERTREKHPWREGEGWNQREIERQ